MGQDSGAPAKSDGGGQYLSHSDPGSSRGRKTTLLRDMIRGLSGWDMGQSLRVGGWLTSGERLPPLWQGSLSLCGRHTDVLDGCAKSEGLSMLMRGNEPQVAAVDEITDPTDVEAVVGCRVRV